MIAEKYIIKIEDIEVPIHITGMHKTPNMYEVKLPELSEGTKVFIDNIKKLLIKKLDVDLEAYKDAEKMEGEKTKLKARAYEEISKTMVGLDNETMRYIVSDLTRDMLGYGKIDIFESDENLEEIKITNSKEPVRVYHKKWGWLNSNIYMDSEEDIQKVSNRIGRQVGKEINIHTPMMDAHLLNGDRVAAAISPVSDKGNCIVIRKFAKDPWTIVDFIKGGTISSKVAAIIWFAMQYELSILVSGGTGAGKTSLMGTLMPFIPPNRHIISIEDTRELNLPRYLHWQPLLTRSGNVEGVGTVSMLDLLVQTLRMRPDILVFGEVRKQREAEELFEAMHTGHSVYATVHADTVRDTVTRLVNPPINIPPYMLDTVSLNLVMMRDRRNNVRRLFQVGEFVITEKDGNISVEPNIVYQYSPKTDKLENIGKFKKLFGKLELFTGMDEKKIKADIDYKEKLLLWMIKNNIRSIDEVGKTIYSYYSKDK
ncbi:MAG: ATPase, T2SS/T4P/T4SS family [Candidatus Woesearchaeota archaeon]